MTIGSGVGVVRLDEVIGANEQGDQCEERQELGIVLTLAIRGLHEPPGAKHQHEEEPAADEPANSGTSLILRDSMLHGHLYSEALVPNPQLLERRSRHSPRADGSIVTNAPTDLCRDLTERCVHRQHIRDADKSSGHHDRFLPTVYVLSFGPSRTNTALKLRATTP
jgi:hypothetical protein